VTTTYSSRPLGHKKKILTSRAIRTFRKFSEHYPCKSRAPERPTAVKNERDHLYLAVGSPQAAVVDDKSGVVLLNGGVKPLDQVGRCPRAGFRCSAFFSGSLLLLRRRFLVLLRRRFLLFCDRLLLECGHRTRPDLTDRLCAATCSKIMKSPEPNWDMHTAERNGVEQLSTCIF